MMLKRLLFLIFFLLVVHLVLLLKSWWDSFVDSLEEQERRSFKRHDDTPRGSLTLTVEPGGGTRTQTTKVNTSRGGQVDASKAREWWNKKASSSFQHLDRDDMERKKKADWNTFLPHFEWHGKKVLDYGIGGGYLGETLFEAHGISSYTGVDISDNAIEATRKTLAKWTGKVDLRLSPVQFSDIAPDILVSQQVIQHFPSVDYFESFLENVDNSRARQLMLHFRKSADERTYATDAYSKGRQQDVTFALLTDSKFIQNRLKNYRLVLNESRPMCCHTTGVYTRWDAI
eukprot:gnl/TRDRNA2_/TRDRNA2_163223_c0_seq9.p1 gnl/TRDRNA2_/TRDRNA2_163223_c0~~gnl/TRDRNA2_/TRDRNA2_163223_c0_seq9.p1  ORF type:complete len:287 (+),score=26.55 gnl/TRDRNA2_/TRDRNA2_163223_c0_seq9:153-1013(+)